jgi:hypothetical protein
MLITERKQENVQRHSLITTWTMLPSRPPTENSARVEEVGPGVRDLPLRGCDAWRTGSAGRDSSLISGIESSPCLDMESSGSNSGGSCDLAEAWETGGFEVRGLDARNCDCDS